MTITKEERDRIERFMHELHLATENNFSEGYVTKKIIELVTEIGTIIYNNVDVAKNKVMEEEIKYIKKFRGDWHDLMAFIKSQWAYAGSGYWEESNIWDEISQTTKREYKLSTGGVSSNESIIAALKENESFFWNMCWYASIKGGHYIFYLDEKEGRKNG